ncbi:hypothetical protein F4781DRAFT_9848 [Annulohypoxylon bovei var. microspora]|nr:hypothetical protein F4781DRAFT_9848 [Annulohypoxylon bovei var. microspora]
MSQQPDLPHLNIKKRRSGDVASSTNLELIFETTEWHRELIEKIKNSQRVMSPLTEERARQIIESLEGIGEDLDTANTPAVHAVRSTLSGLKAEMSRRIETDSKYAECRAKLEKLSKDGFFLRFGDYFANAVGDLIFNPAQVSNLSKMAVEVSKEAKKPQKRGRRQKGEESTNPESETDTMKIFLTQTWIQIDEILTLEEEQKISFAIKAPTPMADLIENLAKMAKMPDYKGIRIAITMYAQRNDIVHRPLVEMAKAGNYYVLATRLRDDLRALVLQRYITPEEKQTTRLAIFKTADWYFEEFKFDEYTYELLDYRPRPAGKDGKPIREKAKGSAPSIPQRRERPRRGRPIPST